LEESPNIIPNGKTRFLSVMIFVNWTIDSAEKDCQDLEQHIRDNDGRLQEEDSQRHLNLDDVFRLNQLIGFNHLR
jgi:hypothetical protein